MNSDLVTFRQRETLSETFIYLMDLHQTYLFIRLALAQGCRTHSLNTQERKELTTLTACESNIYEHTHP